MNLLELLDEVAAETKKEDLQEAWDRCLLRNHLSNANMGKLISWFCTEHDLNWVQFNELKRVPKYQYQVFCQVSRYLAAYLPKIWELLMAGKTNDEIIAYLKRYNLRTLDKPIDLKKTARETKERQQDMLKDKRNVLEQKSRFGQRLRASKSNWNTVKAVRS
jgi:hypothetical protein